VIEGLDRSGKSTQVKRLADKLYSSGYNIKTLRFPDRTSPTGLMINSYLSSQTPMDDHSIHLLFSANRWEKASWIRSIIAAGYTIICDRYVYSGMIYSAAKCNPSLSLEWARKCDEGLPRPDCVVFLSIEEGEQEKRGGFGEERYERREMQDNVRRLFAVVRSREEEESQDLREVDASGGIEEVGERVHGEIIEVLGRVLRGEFRELGTVMPWK
jgi:dTMP kinase